MKNLLSHSWAYSSFRSLMVSSRSMRQFVARNIRPEEDARILDIGCGPADILAFLPGGCQYAGFDANPDYIDHARRANPGRNATFQCQRVSRATLEAPGTWDLVLAIGLVHHLDDGEACQLFELASTALRPGGRMVTLDGVYIPGQSALARWLISRDRGSYVRSPEAYEALGKTRFPDVKTTVEHGLLRLPYTHLVMELSKPFSL